jgi:tetratricopeptide (TPR) repeat protein
MNSSSKKLQALTIIPESLYVRRGADDQLENVVRNMGRPGYVLVARQMGKTNLLLNARRTLGSGKDLFLYVDLSNSYPTLQQFFRNIVDAAIDAYPNHFQHLASEILEARSKNTALPAHKEHEQELRKLLRAVDGKIIICLDEIDALSKSSYSDSVFSLIRSTYFASRINFEEFNRLTYILSGVAEPTEIIKNKDISPFNIGEKIYLDDFSFDEYKRFLEKAGLKFSLSVVERIFYWTNGNPRMCWDLCSSIEDLSIKGVEIAVELVDLTVRKLYLTSYDLPPIDHIRQLAQDDSDIRTAIMNIHFFKYSSITDSQRTKLYLAGIIKADFLSSEVKIKNKVIEEGLSIDWINSVENSKNSLMDRGNKRLAEFDYEGALELFLKYEASVAASESVYLYHNIGECCLHLGDYSGVIEYLSKMPAKRSAFALLYYRQQLWIGIASYKLGDLDGSISRLTDVIESDYSDGYSQEYFEALVNRCASYFEKFEDFGVKILEDSQKVINLIEKCEACDTELANTLICAAYSNIGDAYIKLGRSEDARDIFRKAVSVVDVNTKLSFLPRLLGLVSLGERKEYLSYAADLLGRELILIKDDSIRNRYAFNAEIYADLLLIALELPEISTWNRMLLPLQEGRILGSTVPLILQMVIVLAVTKDKRRLVRAAFGALFPYINEIDVDTVKILFNYCLLIEKSADSEIEKIFIERFSKFESKDLTQRDLLLAYVLSDRLIGRENFETAEDLIKISEMKVRERLKSSYDEDIASAYNAIEFLKIIINLSRGMIDLAVSSAQDLGMRFPKVRSSTSVFEQVFFDGTHAQIERIANMGKRILPVRNGRKIGRNDIVRCRYKDSSVKSGKFKIFTKDLNDGLCELLS